MNKALLLVTVLLGIGIAGCSGGAETSVTKAEEEAFRNPPKGMPPEIAAQMQKSREEGMRKAAELRTKSGG
ncbi:hypothetical protein EON82_09365 [bacterium]|nr:MAG: hypothetical protein EON82_09365 [bacterium]